MNNISPCLWFNNEAEEAANFYVSVFKDSTIVDIMYYPGEEPGVKSSIMSVIFKVKDQKFIALNGRTRFDFTASISFVVNCENDEEINKLWEQLSKDGTVLLELDKHSFSEKYGWVKDKYGVSWQLNIASGSQKIIPYLMFNREQYGKSEEAASFYTALFDNSRINRVKYYSPGEETDMEMIKHIPFVLNTQKFIAIDGSIEHPFTFSPAVSLFVDCETQDEIDELWNKLLEGGRGEKCGLINDRYGVSWRIIPVVLGEMLKDSNLKKAQRVMKTLIKMDKIDIGELKNSYEQ